jgi:hypothetical protein
VISCRARAHAFAFALAALTALMAPTCLSPGVARADDAAARREFRRGVELYDKKQFAEALEAFRAAYAEKPSAIIKQNVALSLVGMGRKVEAATAFDEALDEGQTTLSPETRAAIRRELADLEKSIATLALHVVAASDRRPIEGAIVRVDGAELPPGALRRPIRIAPGIHVVTAHVDGFADPPEKKLGFVEGSPVDATFEMGAAIGTVTLRPDVPASTIKIDGAVVGTGTWSGRLTAGSHRVEVTAPDYRTTVTDVVVTAGASVDYPIALQRAGDVPEPYRPEEPPPAKKPKPYYALIGVGYQGENLQLSSELGEPPAGTRRDLKGASLALRGGGHLSRFFAVELHGEVGSMNTTYTLVPTDTGETKVTVSEWQLTPSLRFSTLGKARFTTGTGFGIHGMHLDSTPPAGAARASKQGTALTPSWLIDFGAQFDVGPLFLEGLLCIDVHGVGTLRDDTSGERLLLASPAARVGLRLGVGLAF